MKLDLNLPRFNGNTIICNIPAFLDLLLGEKSATEAVRLMTDDDPNREHRQRAIIRPERNASIFTNHQ